MGRKPTRAYHLYIPLLQLLEGVLKTLAAEVGNLTSPANGAGVGFSIGAVQNPDNELPGAVLEDEALQVGHELPLLAFTRACERVYRRCSPSSRRSHRSRSSVGARSKPCSRSRRSSSS